MSIGRVPFFAALLWMLVINVRAADITPDESARLSRGEVLVTASRVRDAGSTKIVAAIDIALPAARVWPIMTDCERAPRYVPGLSSCQILQRDAAGAWDIREHISSPGWPLPDFRTVFRSTYEPVRRVHFVRVDGDLKRSEGDWFLQPLNGGASTRVLYVAEVDYDTWVPGIMLRDHLAAQMRRVLLALRRECVRN